MKTIDNHQRLVFLEHLAPSDKNDKSQPLVACKVGLMWFVMCTLDTTFGSLVAVCVGGNNGSMPPDVRVVWMGTPVVL